VARDITGRKAAEGALRDSEATLRSLIDATRETVLLIDPEGTILVANETVARRLGKSVKELVGTSQYQYFPPEIAAHRKEEYDKVVQTGKPVNFQDEMADRVLDTYAYPVFDDEGRVAIVAIFANNIAERKRAEEQLRDNEKKFRDIAELTP
jgi:PAS domain S-box-containing protein